MWVCGSTRPGVTTLPPRSQTLAAPDAGASASGPIQATLPPAMPIAPFGTRPKGEPSCMVATAALRSSRSNMAAQPTGMVSASGGSFTTLAYQASSLGWPGRHGSLA